MTYCGAEYCEKCPSRSQCGGCEATCGKPMGGRCVAAEWKKAYGGEGLAQRRQILLDEINALGIPGLHVEELSLLMGAYVNLAYPLPSGEAVKLLRDSNVYYGSQIELPGSDRCYGVLADDTMLLIARYGCGGSNPEIILFKQR